MDTHQRSHSKECMAYTDHFPIVSMTLLVSTKLGLLHAHDPFKATRKCAPIRAVGLFHCSSAAFAKGQPHHNHKCFPWKGNRPLLARILRAPT